VSPQCSPVVVVLLRYQIFMSFCLCIVAFCQSVLLKRDDDDDDDLGKTERAKYHFFIKCDMIA